MSIFGDVLNAVTGFVSSAADRKATRRQANTQFARDQEVAAQNRQFQLDMWNRTNDYNNPAEQMKRLKAAGLNPHLAHGTGTVAAQNQQVPETVSTPVPNYGGFIKDGLNMYTDLRAKDNSNDLMQLEMAYKAQQIAESGKRVEGIDSKIANTRFSEFKNLFDIENRQSSTRLNNAKTSEQYRSTALSNRLEENSVQFADQKLYQLQLQNNEQEITNANLPAKQKADLMATAARITLMQKQGNQQDVDYALKREQLELRKNYGIETGDNLFARFFGKYLSDNGAPTLGNSPDTKDLTPKGKEERRTNWRKTIEGGKRPKTWISKLFNDNKNRE